MKVLSLKVARQSVRTRTRPEWNYYQLQERLFSSNIVHRAGIPVQALSLLASCIAFLGDWPQPPAHSIRFWRGVVQSLLTMAVSSILHCLSMAVCAVFVLFAVVVLVLAAALIYAAKYIRYLAG